MNQQPAPKAAIVPTIGRIVYYVLPQYQVEEINRRRQHARNELDYHRWKKNGTMIHVGNEVKAGQVVPAMIVAVWGATPTSAVNLKLFLDGSDDYWVTSTNVGEPDQEGKYHWMPYQLGQAAKTEAAEKEIAAAKQAAFNDAAGEPSKPA
ncbi:hypothetical protein [Bradyrhizobium elkanii]|uniref:Uncharacterized protein n=1 Tax=Bradyrhizobium elkanii TaxID=29448 RepID=A0A8I1YAZ7_BRAEL|nr:hypothetical protein [Bradyrhizobium elkanii]MBP1296635.1 hypothetical protein [Bradyrhizobium elkanii]